MMASGSIFEPSSKESAKPMPSVRTRWVVVGVIALFMALFGTIVYLRVTKAISFELTLLMLVALLGLYLGFGVLIAVYRLVQKLE
jgi:hypothetical protein